MTLPPPYVQTKISGIVFFGFMEYNLFCVDANLAQLVEQRYRKPQVAGSNPAVGSTENHLIDFKWFFCIFTVVTFLDKTY